MTVMLCVRDSGPTQTHRWAKDALTDHVFFHTQQACSLTQMAIKQATLHSANLIFSERSHTPFCFSMWTHWNGNTQECTVVATDRVESCLRLFGTDLLAAWKMFPTQTCAGWGDWHPNSDADHIKFDQSLSSGQEPPLAVWLARFLRYLVRGHYPGRPCQRHQVGVFLIGYLCLKQTFVLCGETAAHTAWIDLD